MSFLIKIGLQKNLVKKTLNRDVEILVDSSVTFLGTLSEVSHSFTRYRVKLSSYLFEIENHQVIPSYEWLTIEDADKKAFSSGHRKLLNLLKERSLK